MSIDWKNIKSFNNSQNNAFEELVCQLAREELIVNKKEFYRVAAPDGGVEAYCILDNGEEYGWQAKYFSTMGSSQWTQLKDSFETTLKTHPNLTKYYICIPLDRQDPRREDQSWFMDKWNEKTLEWLEIARKQGRNITFEYWGSFELIHRLSEEKNAGRKYFWFSKEEFTDEWFQSNIKRNILNLGVRYTPEVNFELTIATYFNAISRNQGFHERFKKELHHFLKEFRSLDDEVLQTDSVIKFLSFLNNQFERCKKPEPISFEIDAIKQGLILVYKSLDVYQHTLQSNKVEIPKETLESKQHYLGKAYNGLDQLQKFIYSPILDLANLPVLLLSGEAGIGKSHLLADIAVTNIKNKKACILLLGQHFSNEESPWRQILSNLLRLNCNESELLGALNAKAECQGERLLFIIDAINEGKGRYFWGDHIRAFINDFSKYPWLGLVLSIRTSYEPLLASKTLIPDEAAIRIVHHGFEGIEYQASSFFFSQHGIEQPGIPLLHPEFSNPLFLKLFCEGLSRSGQKRIPKGYSGITSIIDFFLNSIDEKLSSPSLFDYQPYSGKKLVKKVINAIAKHKIENSLSYVTYDKAIEIANKIVSNYSNRKDFIDQLISEGVLSKNISWNDNNEDVIYFAYERFEDHLIVAYLLDTYLDPANPEYPFHNNGILFQYLHQSYQYQGIVEALSIQLPEKIGKELYELIPGDKPPSPAIVESFIESLIWRKPETIKDKTRTFVNKYVLNDTHASDLFYEMVYSVSSDPAHFYNADSLHRFLMKFSMPDRDAFWTTYLHDKDESVSSMQRLLDWSLQENDKCNLTGESRLLAGKAIAWLFTSTNIRFRDKATKSLVCLLENNLSTITNLLVAFNNVNDPYVYERILAAAYGAVLRSKNLDGLTKLSKYIFQTIFQQEEVYPNALIRDYSKNILEYALYKSEFSLEDISIISPPYKSRFPDDFPTNEEIDAYKYDYQLQDSKKYCGQNAILRSMVTEYGRGICSYGDFGRYTFQSKLHSWCYRFDPNDLSNYACKLIFEKYGYDANKHGKFDNYASQGDRHSNKKERIGKKYQWLALYEVLSRVSDNFQMQEGWGDDKEYSWYKGAWEPAIRNIDPTFIFRENNELTDYAEADFSNKVGYSDWQDTDNNWLVSSDSLPDVKEIIEFIYTDNDWLFLEIHPSWSEPVPIGFEQYDHPHKHIWYQIRSYFLSEDEADTFIAWAETQHFMGRWFPETSSQYQVFSREYYWSPAYRFFDDPYYGRSQWEDVHEHEHYGKVKGKVMVTNEGHNWESGSDNREQSSYLAPREMMFKKMNLQYSHNIGEWLNKEGELVCLDPSVNRSGDYSLAIRKDGLMKFLSENGLRLFWTCLGEKQILGDSVQERKYSQWLEVSGIFTLGASHVEGCLTPRIQSVSIDLDKKY